MQNQKGFIQIPLLIAIIVSIVAVLTVTTGVVLHKQGKLSSLVASVSQVFKGTEDAEPEIKSEEPQLEEEQPLPKEPQEEPQGENQEPENNQPEPQPGPQSREEELKVEPCAHVICSNCQFCVDGNCVPRFDGYNDCGSGCQRCIDGSCRDSDVACSDCQYCGSDTCINYCQRTDTSCGCAHCVNCNNSDSWINAGSSYSCCDGNKACVCQKQEYRDYTCSGTSCNYSVTNTKIDKNNCTECSPAGSCLSGSCRTNCVGTDISCGSENCVNCNNSDGWVNSISIPFPYCDGNKTCTDQKQEYRDYFCLGSSCSYSVTDARTNKSCIECGSSKYCSGGTCLDKPTKQCEWIWQGTISGSSVTPFSSIISCTVEKEGSTGYILGVSSDVYPGNKYLSTSIELSPGSMVHRYLCRCK